MKDNIKGIRDRVNYTIIDDIGELTLEQIDAIYKRANVVYRLNKEMIKKLKGGDEFIEVINRIEDALHNNNSKFSERINKVTSLCRTYRQSNNV